MNTGIPITMSIRPTTRTQRDDSSRREERYWLVSGTYAPDIDEGVIFNYVHRTSGDVPNGVRFFLEGEEGELDIHGINELIPEEDAVVILNESLPRNDTTHDSGQIVDIGDGIKEIVTNDETDGYIIEGATEEKIQRLSENGTHQVFRGDDLRSLRDEDHPGDLTVHVRNNLSLLTSS